FSHDLFFTFHPYFSTLYHYLHLFSSISCFYRKGRSQDAGLYFSGMYNKSMIFLSIDIKIGFTYQGNLTGSTLKVRFVFQSATGSKNNTGAIWRQYKSVFRLFFW